MLASYLSLEYIDLPVLDVDLIPQLGELVGQPVLVLGRAQGGLGLLLNHLVLLFQLATELINLEDHLAFDSGFKNLQYWWTSLCMQ